MIRVINLVFLLFFIVEEHLRPPGQRHFRQITTNECESDTISVDNMYNE